MSRSQGRLAGLSSTRVEPALPVTSLRLTSSVIKPLAALSTAAALSDSLPASYIPTTSAPVASLFGSATFVLNSKAISVRAAVSIGKRVEWRKIIPALYQPRHNARGMRRARAPDRTDDAPGPAFPSDFSTLAIARIRQLRRCGIRRTVRHHRHEPAGAHVGARRRRQHPGRRGVRAHRLHRHQLSPRAARADAVRRGADDRLPRLPGFRDGDLVGFRRLAARMD